MSSVVAKTSSAFAIIGFLWPSITKPSPSIVKATITTDRKAIAHIFKPCHLTFGKHLAAVLGDDGACT